MVVVALVMSACSQPASDCPDVYFVGVRGSGQEVGVGPELSDLYRQTVDEHGGDIELVALDYPALQSPLDASAYRESVLAGAAALPEALDALPCDSPVVVAGFSQGAHVITLANVQADAVVLLASPVFSPTDATAKSGDFNPEQHGVIADQPIEGPAADRTIQVCLAGDPVCQLGSFSFSVHTDGYIDEALSEAAEFAASLVRN